MPLVLSNSSIYANGPSAQSGCVGGFFTLPGSQDVFGITNFHVVEKGGIGTLNAPIFKLGSVAKIGLLEYWYQLDTHNVNYFDMALFAIDKAVATPVWNVAVGGWADANNAVQVQLTRANGIQTFGIAAGLKNGPFNITLERQPFQFTNLLQIHSTSTTVPFSSPGDSGSLIFSGGNIVALLLGADTNEPFISYGIPFIDSINNKGILNYFQLTPMS